MKLYWYRNVVIASIFIMALASCSPANEMPTVVLPAGKAFSEGKEIYFVHTETSDAGLADLLTKMMNSPVLYVPSLANAPSGAIAQVYVFENGMKGMGPLGFQADVFDNPPGSAGYSPLRQVNVVTWSNPGAARLLKTAGEITTAQKAGELAIKATGQIVNMPFVVWDGGKR